MTCKPHTCKHGESREDGPCLFVVLSHWVKGHINSLRVKSHMTQLNLLLAGSFISKMRKRIFYHWVIVKISKVTWKVPSMVLVAGLLTWSLQLCQSLCKPIEQPTRLLCPWDSPGNNTGVGCHTLLQGMFLIQAPNPLLFTSLGLAGRFFITSTTWEAHGAGRYLEKS